MLSAVRKTTVLTLALVFFFNTCAFGVLFAAEIHWHQLEQFKELSLKKENTQQMVLPAELVENGGAQFQWKKNWEFCYNGEMYDVVTSVKNGDSYTMLVKHDTKEEKLIRKAERQAEHERKARESQAKKNLKVNILIADVHQYTLPSLIFSERNIPQRQPVICASHRTLPDPPPWIG
jgi:hypothetical protein